MKTIFQKFTKYLIGIHYKEGDKLDNEKKTCKKFQYSQKKIFCFV